MLCWKMASLEYVMPGNTAYVSDLCQAAVEMQIQSVTVKEWSFWVNNSIPGVGLLFSVCSDVIHTAAQLATQMQTIFWIEKETYFNKIVPIWYSEMKQ